MPSISSLFQGLWAGLVISEFRLLRARLLFVHALRNPRVRLYVPRLGLQRLFSVALVAYKQCVVAVTIIELNQAFNKLITLWLPPYLHSYCVTK